MLLAARQLTIEASLRPHRAEERPGREPLLADSCCDWPATGIYARQSRWRSAQDWPRVSAEAPPLTVRLRRRYGGGIYRPMRRDVEGRVKFRVVVFIIG